MSIATPTPIKREDIRAGDRVRQVTEFTATHDFMKGPKKSATYELLERPVVLPTTPGVTISWDSPFHKHLATLEKADQWLYGQYNKTTAEMIDRIAETAIDGTTFTVLRPEAEVAKEVLDDVGHENRTSGATMAVDRQTVATKYGVVSR